MNLALIEVFASYIVVGCGIVLLILADGEDIDRAKPVAALMGFCSAIIIACEVSR